MTAKKKRTLIEWVGGLVPLPGFVTGEGEPFRPEALFWLGADGAVLAHTVGAPGELMGLAAEHLRRTIERPMHGEPHVPASVRVASPELAEALRAVHTRIEIVCAPTPEIDTLLAGMREQMGQDAEAERSYLSSETGPEAVEAFFRAAAGLFRAKPWEIVPSDQSLLSVTIEALGVHDVALSVIGQMGQSLGFLLFSGLDDFSAFLEAAADADRDEAPWIPPHFAVNFERGADLSPALRREILQHGWEVAGADAYPWLVAVDEELVTRPATADELSIAEAIAQALPQLLVEKDALLAAWNGGAAVVRTLRVTTSAGDLEVTLRVPYAQSPVRVRPSSDLMAELRELGDGDDGLDEAARQELEDALVRRFSESPEGKSVSDTGVCHFVMGFAADYFGSTIATLQPAQLREIVFEIIPRKVSVPATAAGEMLDELRAFFSFLKREFAHAQADACLRVLAGDAVKRLTAALKDSSKFGMAKSLLMGGQDAGFDMTTREGVEAWMSTMQSLPLPSSVLPPFFGPTGSSGPTSRPDKRVDARAKKGQRKAARKARKKNR